jgi:beta-lactamase superfamily II metal-dependent hydrolase
VNELRVRVYNVRFGDAVLVTVPDADDAGRPMDRHLLIDVGNALATSGGQNDVFKPIFTDIVQETGGVIDLYVSTHEHLDHTQGLLFSHNELGTDLTFRQVWMTASAEGDPYYDRHDQAKRKRDLAMALVSDIEARLPLSLRDTWVENLLANNGFPGPHAASSGSTDACVDFVRQHTNPDHTTSPKSFVYRRDEPGGWPHPFRVATLEVWAPEEDTSAYYGRFQPSALGAAPPGAGGVSDGEEAPDLLPPAGVDAESFYRLVGQRTQGFWDNLLAIDQARNNSSVVFCLTWKGWKLLFPGDAEVRSYKEMGKRGVLEPVHFLKVGHHGSHNGTPPDDLLDQILPPVSPDGRPRHAVVSTADETYPGVPDAATLDDRLTPRCSLVDTRTLAPGSFTDLLFPPY